MRRKTISEACLMTIRLTTGWVQLWQRKTKGWQIYWAELLKLSSVILKIVEIDAFGDANT